MAAVLLHLFAKTKRKEMNQRLITKQARPIIMITYQKDKHESNLHIVLPNTYLSLLKVITYSKVLNNHTVLNKHTGRENVEIQ